MTPIGTMIVVFDISEVNGVIQGVAETVDILDAVADGNRLTWTQMVTTLMKLTLKFNVTVEGDTMTGGYKAGIFPASKVNATWFRQLHVVRRPRSCLGSAAP